jgi:hypothetical protein
VFFFWRNPVFVACFAAETLITEHETQIRSQLIQQLA